MYPGWSARDNYAIHKKRRKRKVKQVDSKASGEEPPLEDRNKDGKRGGGGGRLALYFPLLYNIIVAEE